MKKPNKPTQSIRDARYDELKRMLLGRREELVRKVKIVTAQRPIPTSLGGRVSSDDQAGVDSDGDVELRLVEMRADEVKKIDDALARLQSRKYGNCFDCGEPIAENRLNFMPFAVRCKDCEEKREVASRRRREGSLAWERIL